MLLLNDLLWQRYCIGRIRCLGGQSTNVKTEISIEIAKQSKTCTMYKNLKYRKLHSEAFELWPLARKETERETAQQLLDWSAISVFIHG